jgi:hypothetical protein
VTKFAISYRQTAGVDTALEFSEVLYFQNKSEITAAKTAALSLHLSKAPTNALRRQTPTDFYYSIIQHNRVPVKKSG